MEIEKVVVMILGEITMELEESSSMSSSMSSPSPSKKTTKQNYHKSAILQVNRHMVERGEYNFPFTFELERGILPSFKYPERECQGPFKSVSIRYFLQAEVLRPKINPMAVRGEINIRRFDSHMEETVVMRTFQRTLKCCYCFKQGHISFTVQIPKPNYHPEDSIRLSLHLVNNGSRNEKFEEAKIRTILRVEDPRVMDKSEIDIVPIHSISITSQEDFTTTILMELPRKLQPSIHTDILNARYFFIIELESKEEEGRGKKSFASSKPVYLELPFEIDC